MVTFRVEAKVVGLTNAAAGALSDVGWVQTQDESGFVPGSEVAQVPTKAPKVFLTSSLLQPSPRRWPCTKGSTLRFGALPDSE